VLRFADSNPGVWMMHCHINWHQVHRPYKYAALSFIFSLLTISCSRVTFIYLLDTLLIDIISLDLIYFLSITIAGCRSVHGIYRE
jgi:hypothetical protein